eukprot:TRINITY_DN1322_c0_g1_i1.p1 TRINITY_DN1322_c0_g1~~TRINITY_DN1322_c0_g1_i1.p1  ORF type:complete len:197 (+),score=32.31 TRINITY_DN1322_c0_g1_i1:219-809(+)
MSKQVILAFGDSLTEGYYRFGRKFHPYTIKLQELLDKHYPSLFETVNYGVSGERTSSMVRRIKTIQIENLKYAIVLGGTNDLHLGIPADICDNLAQIHNYLREKGVISIAVTIPETFAEGKFQHIALNRNETNRLLADFCTKSHIPLLDLCAKIPNLSATEEERKKHYDDALHFTPLGYDTFGELLFELLDSLLKK